MLRRFAAVVALSLTLAATSVPAFALPPYNDDFADAEVIDVFTLYQYASAEPSEATTEDGENACASNLSVWYTFTLEASIELGFYVLAYDTDGVTDYPIPTVETHVGLYQQGAPEPTLLRCDTGGSAHDVTYRQTLDAGTYYVQIGAAAGTAPDKYHLVVGVPPSNDTLASALPVTPTGEHFTTLASLASSGDGEHTCADRHSRWYSITLDKRSDLNIFVNTIGIGVQLGVQSTIGIYKREGDQLTLVKCQSGGAPFGYGYDVLFTKTLDAGTYYLQVGVANRPPNWTLLLLSATPPNDKLSKAAAVAFPIDESASAMLASFQPGVEPDAQNGCSMPLHHSVWYKFTLDTTRVVDLNALNSNLYIDTGGETTRFPPYMDVWKKDGSSLLPVDCDKQGGVVRKTLSPGTYLVRLASPAKLQRRFPTYLNLNGLSEPVGLPVIHDQPDTFIANGGDSAMLSVMATSDTPLSYQWYQGQPSDISQPIPGATGAIYTTPPLNNNANYGYWVRVTNAVGNRDSIWAGISTYGTIYTAELLDNGGFENGMTGWTLENGSGDKVVCDSDTRPPQGDGSPCAFVFKGSASESATLTRTVFAASHHNTSFALSFMMKTVNSVKPLKVRVTVTYSDGQPATVTKLRYVQTEGYMRLSSGINVYLSSNPNQVTLSFKHISLGGKTIIDDVSLKDRSYYSGRDGVLPPPAAPSGFRSP